MRAGAGERVCEVGCGTARNLVILAGRHPSASFYGLDASSEMLRSARAAVDRAGLGGRVRLALGLAGALDRRALFGVEPPCQPIRG